MIRFHNVSFSKNKSNHFSEKVHVDLCYLFFTLSEAEADEILRMLRNLPGSEGVKKSVFLPDGAADGRCGYVFNPYPSAHFSSSINLIYLLFISNTFVFLKQY